MYHQDGAIALAIPAAIIIILMFCVRQNAKCIPQMSSGEKYGRSKDDDGLPWRSIDLTHPPKWSSSSPSRAAVEIPNICKQSKRGHALLTQERDGSTGLETQAINFKYSECTATFLATFIGRIYLSIYLSNYNLLVSTG